MSAVSWPAVKSPAHLHTRSPLTPFVFLCLFIPHNFILGQIESQTINCFITTIACLHQLFQVVERSKCAISGQEILEKQAFSSEDHLVHSKNHLSSKCTRVIIALCCAVSAQTFQMLQQFGGRLSLSVVLLLHQNVFRVGIVVFVDVEILGDSS